MSLDLVRQMLERAENAGDAAAIAALMTADVVAMVPSAPVIEGREACGAFVAEMLTDLLEVFERHVTYTSAETVVLGDHAYDRGTFAIACVSRSDGTRHEAAGKYFWLLRRDAGEWRLARLIHAVDDAAEPPSAPETIETARLRLSRPRPADAAGIFDRYASDPEVTRYLAWPTHRTVADAEAFVAFSDAQWATQPAGPYLIRSRDDGRLLGGTGLQIERDGSVTTGYVLARDTWGRGVATEALQAMVTLAGELGFPELTALCHADHTASRRVLEKCGFTADPARSEQAFPNLTGAAQTVLRYVRVLIA